MLDSADVYVLLKVAIMRGSGGWSQSGLGHEIGVSSSVVNRALKKAGGLNLYSPARRHANARLLEEALAHGARYFLAPKRGGEVRGMPTAWAAPPLFGEILSDEALPPVWPDPAGVARGLSLEPLHTSAPQAARRDPEFYEVLALVDVLRVGGARERALAEKKLHERMVARVEG